MTVGGRASEQRRATLADVAQRARVDRSVVSRVVNGDERLHIRDETRHRVLQAVADLCYRPNALAQGLRRAEAHAYGLIVPNFSNPAYAEIITGAEEAAVARGRVLMTRSSEGRGGALQDLRALVDGWIDGVLLAGAEIDTELFDQMASAQLPLLLLNRRTVGASRYVILDDERAARLAMQHLVGLGHVRIAHLSGPAWADTAVRRRSGYEAVMAEFGLVSDRDLVVETDYSSAGGVRAMDQLLERTPRPTGVFVANVAAAIGALHACRRAGVEVPRELSVVGVHEIPLAEHLGPPLTTVRLPLAELGRRGVELLATRSPTATIRETLSSPIELVVRESTAPPCS